jgi:nitrilase
MRIGAAQTAPAWGDPTATAAVVVEWMGRAANAGVELVAFGETFLAGYPYWVARTDGARWDAADQKEAYAFYLDAAVRLDGPELALIREAATDLGVFVYVGIAERSASGGTVYATLVAVDPEAGVVSAHRKTMPTFEERMVWGIGDGHGLRVHDVGRVRVGGLNCWENWVPVVRHSLYAQGIDLHVAVWPGSTRLTEDITRFIAKEGRCYVLSAGAILRDTDVATAFPLKEASFDRPEMAYNGGSAIAAPDGSWLVAPVAGEERLVIADIDVATVRGERQNFDPAGHYFRSDVFSVTVNRRRLEPGTFTE